LKPPEAERGELGVQRTEKWMMKGGLPLPFFNGACREILKNLGLEGREERKVKLHGLGREGNQ